MVFLGFNRRRRERRRRTDGSRPRSLGCVWPLFWLILLVVLLGLIFGGYHKGTKVGSQIEFGGWSARSSGSTQGSAALHNRVY
jgi:hypothetical protein